MVMSQSCPSTTGAARTEPRNTIARAMEVSRPAFHPSKRSNTAWNDKVTR